MEKNLNDFIEKIKTDKIVDLKNQQTKSIAISSEIHQKIKQIAFLYNIPLSNLVGGVLNEWISGNKKAIIKDKKKFIEREL